MAWVDFKIDGIVLSSKAFFEKDKRVILFSPTMGKICFLAKNAMAAKSVYTGLLEVSNLVWVEGYSRKGFHYLKQCEVRCTFPAVRETFESITLALYAIEVILKGTPFEQPNPGLYTLLWQTLTLLERKEPLASIKAWFQTQYLVSEGLIERPSLTVTDAFFKNKYEQYTGMFISPPALATL